MYWIWTLIVGAIIGAIAGAITNRSGSMGWIANIIAGRASAAGARNSAAWPSSHRSSARSSWPLLSRSS